MVQRVEYPYRMGQKLLSHGGQLRAKPATFKQTNASQLLQLIQGLGEGRLAEAKRLCRPAQCALLRNRNKGM